MAAEAASIIDTEDGLLITDVVLAETAYVLMSVYEVPRAMTVDLLMSIVQRKNVSPFGLNKGLVLDALLMCRESGRVSFDDAMVWAAARSAGIQVVYSMDRRFPNDGVEILP